MAESPALPDPASPADVGALRDALARERRVSQALSEVGKALGTTLDLDDLLELILGRVTELLDADRATLYLVDEVRGDLVSRVVVGDAVRSIRMKLGRGLAGAVAMGGKPIRIDDAYQDPRFEREWDQLTGYRTSTMLAVPLKNHLGRTIGVIQVLNKNGGQLFRDEDEALLIALSTQAAVAIDNSRLFLSLIQKNRQLLDTKEQLERRVTDLQLLFDLERATARADTLEELVQAALASAARSCEARGAALLLADDETGDLVHYVLDVENPASLDRFGVKAGEGFLSAAMDGDEVVQLNEGAADARFSEHVERRYRFPIMAVLCVPLEGERRPGGAMGLFSKLGGRPFRDDDVSLLNLVAANVSTAVRLFRSNLARENEQRLTTIGRLLSQVIHDFKTPMTVISGHVQLMQHADSAEQRREHAAKILKQFDVLTSMQKEVLAFARGETKIFVRKVYLHKFFNDLRAQLGHEVDGRAIELEMDVDAKAVARFDETKMARAMQNLTRNAIEAMAERGGRLTLFGRVVPGEGGQELVLGVQDTGPGIPAEIEGRLFQSFVTAGKKGGTGLGLAIVRKIVEEHQGRVVSKSSSSGARFELHIPMLPARSASIPPAPAGEPRTDSGAREEPSRPNSSPTRSSPTKSSPTKSSPTKSSPTKSSPTKSSPRKSSPRKSRPRSRVPKP